MDRRSGRENIRPLEAKVVVLGSQGVGKTSVIVRYTKNCYNRTISPTIGASFFTCTVRSGDCAIKMQVWDTAGQERFRAMAPIYYRKAHAALLVYDITSYESFTDITTWVRELKNNTDENLVICLLGNKSDLGEARKVPIEEAESYASTVGAAHFETSAVSSTGIRDVFRYLAKSLLLKFEEQKARRSEDIISNSSENHFGTPQRPSSSLITDLNSNKTMESKSCC